MTTEVVLPKWGMGIEEATVVRWLKSVGEKVSKGEPLAEIETAKSVQELAAPVDGTLVRILLPENESAAVNTVIAEIA